MLMTSNKKFGVMRLDGRQGVFAIFYMVFLFNFIVNGYEFGTPVTTVRFTAFALLLTGLMQRRIEKKWLSLQGILIIVSALISAFFSDTVDFTTSRIWNFIFCVVVFMVISTSYIRCDYFEKILSFYVNLALILSVLVVLGYVFRFGIDSYGRASINYGAFYKDQNYLSAYFMPAFAMKMYDIVVKNKRSIRNIIYPFSFMLASLLMGSRGSFLTAVLISFIIVMWFILHEKRIVRKMTMIILLVLVASIVYLVLYNSTLFQRMTEIKSYGSDVRLRLWAAGLSGFLKHKIIGSGIGAASQYSYGMVGNAVHNSFIEVLSDQGIIGIVLVLWILVRIVTVKLEDKLLGITFFVGLFCPLFFLTGYSNFSFWMPMFFLQNFLSYLEEKPLVQSD